MRRTLISLALLASCSPLASMAATSHAALPVSGIDLQWQDHSVRPQDDFYRYVSGKWMERTEIPADRARFGAFDHLRDLSEQRTHAIITGLAAAPDLAADSEQRKVADLYRSFMDQSRIDTLDSQPLAPLFAQIDALSSRQQLPALMASLSELELSLPLQLSISQDARDARSYAVYLGQGGLSMPDRDYYLKDDAKMQGYRQAYLLHLEKMLSMSGDSTAKDHAAAILALETALAKIQWSKVENRDPLKTYHKIEVAKLSELLPDFDWRAYLDASGVGTRTSYLIVRQDSYLRAMAGILQDTPLPVWQAYYKWKVLDAYAPFLSQRYADQHFAFNSVTLRGIPENQARWKRAVARVEESLPDAVGKLYVAQYFSAADKAKMEQLVGNLILAYRHSIQELSWMSPATKQEALAKLAKFTPKIGYPDKWRDYSELKIAADDLLGNIRRGRSHEYRRKLAQLGQPVDRSEWFMSPQTVNAYFNPRMNEIVFPAAILQVPFFNRQADDAVNYGGIGAVIGHEISHGFDDSGSHYDGDGNLRDWWSETDKHNFKQLTTALVKQYAAYSPLPGYNINGALTLGENIADNSGLAIALKAYQLSLQGKPAALIDGYTGEQRLILGWAQVWRTKTRDAEAIRLLSIDPHSPGAARSNLPLMNLPAFYTAFELKPGDQMYLAPQQRVTIW
ncbi:MULTISPECIES: M13 family metallopeptidase [unclassified Undibacterium]|uniref:M13 family metallopeptidase n=1 Tax=unclassified Undibacterium TaxID=2630295 RepID=UPI002AC9E6F0|nr:MULTISPECIES: M13-type metalloendopeptidase [unclassified Undibacterium]MEB0138139.1 M13-type metalloendopeptidase [Undibacterium sp. CCC2.1]MEB0171106.1 M13-type metalloendopeptidase [Undibacterium sp. CCC1.1]MEB0175151.1 M13-type metalloendopeptidase [Undibacterium sp. CCC3.4]MEB0214265.1 M13-type metalloendopeptidase [Undibacterium sp. 5I2]WPX41845.1 M13-type metalloendopeptidase [Undibacterium sp. CCC3.4]